MTTHPAFATLLLTLSLSHIALAAESASWEKQVEQAVREGRLDDAGPLAEAAVHDSKTAGAAYEWLGRVSLARVRYEEAALHFEKAQEHGKSLTGFAESWSKALMNLGQRRQACSVLDGGASAATADDNLRYLAGTCFLQLGEPQRALPHLETVYQNGLRHTGVLTHLARAQLDSGWEDRAVELLRSMIESSSSPSLLLELGKMLFQKVLYRQSLEAFEKAFHAKPGWYDAGMYLALAHYLLEEYEQSAAVLAGMNLEPGPVEYQYLRGSVYARLGDYERAQRELERSVELAPDRAGGYLNLGLFHLERGDRAEALELLDQGAARASSEAKIFYTIASRTNCHGLVPPDTNELGDAGRAQLYIHLADQLLAGQQWGSALEVYLVALQIAPRAARPYGGLGLICQELGSAEVGLNFLNRGVALHPNDAQLHYYLGSIYSYLSKSEHAIESYETALRLSEQKGPGRYWLRLGLAQLAGGRQQEAEASFRAALEREPDFAEAHYQLGKLQLASRRFPEAEALLEKSVQLDSSLVEAYYSWGLSCIRNGRAEKGREILESYQRKKALRQAQVKRQGMSAAAPGLPTMEP